MYLGDPTLSLVDGYGGNARFDKSDRGTIDVSDAKRPRRVQQPSPQAAKSQQGIQITPGIVTTSLLLATLGFPLAAPLAGLIPGLRRGSDAFGNTVNSGLKSTFSFFKDTFKSILGQDQFQELKHYVRQASPDDANSDKRPRRVNAPLPEPVPLQETGRRDTRDAVEITRARRVTAEPEGFFNRVGNGFAAVGSGIREIGSQVFDTIGSGLSTVGSAIGSGVKAVGSAVGGFFGKLFGGGSDKAAAAS